MRNSENEMRRSELRAVIIDQFITGDDDLTMNRKIKVPFSILHFIYISRNRIGWRVSKRESKLKYCIDFQNLMVQCSQLLF